jgi:hypothetical protein
MRSTPPLKTFILSGRSGTSLAGQRSFFAMGSSRSPVEWRHARVVRDPQFAKHAGDLVGLAVYLGLGQLRRRPGRARRLMRSLAVRGQIRDAFAPEQKQGRRGPLVVAVGATAGLALARSARRKRHVRRGHPSLEPEGDNTT